MKSEEIILNVIAKMKIIVKWDDEEDEYVIGTYVNGVQMHGKCSPSLGAPLDGDFFECASSVPMPPVDSRVVSDSMGRRHASYVLCVVVGARLAPARGQAAARSEQRR